MNAMTKKLMKGAQVAVALGESQYGTAEPRIELRFPRDLHYRARKAALLALAAEVEMASGPSDSWCVQLVDGNYETGVVYLELADGTGDEAKRGMALLGSVVA